MRKLYIFVLAFSLITFSFNSKAQEDVNAFNAGMIAYKKQEYQNAVYAFENALYFNEKNYQTYCMLGVSYTLNDEPQKAEKIYQKAINTFPKEWKAYVLLGEFYETQKDYANAYKYYQESINLLPAKQKKVYQKNIYNLSSKLFFSFIFIL